MNKIHIAALGLLALGTLNAQTFTEWQDPTINQVNRLPAHASFFAYESSEAAKADKSASERFISLDGDWNFIWVPDSDKRPTDFFRTDYNDSHWGSMPVPGMWEKYGYGDPLYLNIGYAWKNQFENNPPQVPVAKNSIGTYRRWIDVPETWKGEQIIAHFGSVTSNMYLWVNGKFVGYSEDSKIAAEFDITKYIKPGRNLFAMQVFRWCDGTYLEDQDFFRFAGIARECYLYSRNAKHIKDLRFNTKLDESYTQGTIEVEIESSASDCTAELELSYKGRSIAKQSLKLSSKNSFITIPAGEVLAWTAETPNLYDLTTTLKDSKGQTLEVIPLKAGFRDVRIEDGFLKVNGKVILVKGADRHELDPDGGYVVSVERMIEDIKILKEFNFNAVRTCHYPDDPRWYDLCDQYGIYLVAEANVESHGMGYDETSLSRAQNYKQAHLERNERNVRSFYNHPSIIVWSLGNESGDGTNFDACYDWVKSFDKTRPVQYEGVIHSDRNVTDVFCPMYYSPEDCEEYASSNPSKPLIQCEYAHAMGNSLGGFKEYWDLIRKYPHYQGGFIWDFVDQGQRKIGKNGAMIYGYGGDWNPYDAHDFNFCDNGLISPDRVPNPHMYEARYQQQSIWSKLVAKETVEIYNEYCFIDLSNFTLQWELLCEGKKIRAGVVSELSIAPSERKAVQLAYGELPCKGEVLLNLNFITKEADGIIDAGHRIAYQQLTIREREQSELTISTRMRDKHNSAGELVVDCSDANYIILSSPLMRIDFYRNTGLITRYEVSGRKLLAEEGVLQPDFWRAGTDNDFGANLNSGNRVWENPRMVLKDLKSNMVDGLAIVTATYSFELIPGTLTLEYRINNAGDMVVKQSLKATKKKDIPDLMRFAMRMKMPSEYDRVSFYGRGPWENYTDRNSGASLGIYNQTVAEQAYSYIRPQETGMKSDLRWLKVENISHHGIELTGAKPFLASALNYSHEMLDEGWNKRNMHTPEVEPCKETWLTICGYEYGLGCITSWGALPLEQYRLPYQDYELEYKIRVY